MPEGIQVIGTIEHRYCYGCQDYGTMNVIKGLGNYCSDCTKKMKDEKPGVQEQ